MGNFFVSASMANVTPDSGDRCSVAILTDADSTLHSPFARKAAITAFCSQPALQ
jgi:hypothetical protein